MELPTCTDTALVMRDRQGVEIDHCPQCRGVWLDRGALDKRVERSAAMTPAPAAKATVQSQSQPQFAADIRSRSSQPPTTGMAEASRATARRPG